MATALEQGIRLCQQWDLLTRISLLVLAVAGGLILGLPFFLAWGWPFGLIVAAIPPLASWRFIFRRLPPDDDAQRAELAPALLQGPVWAFFALGTLGLVVAIGAVAVPLVWWRTAPDAMDPLGWKTTLWVAMAMIVAGLGWAGTFLGQGGHQLTLHQTFATLGRQLEQDPENLDLWYDRAWLWQTTGRLDRAIADFSELIWLDSESPENYYHRAVCHCAAGDFAAAIEDFSTAIDLDSEEPSRYLDRGYCYLDWSRHDDAIADFSKVIELDPENPEAFEGRAEALEGLGDRKQAGRDWVKADRLRRRYSPPADRDQEQNEGEDWN